MSPKPTGEISPSHRQLADQAVQLFDTYAADVQLGVDENTFLSAALKARPVREGKDMVVRLHDLPPTLAVLELLTPDGRPVTVSRDVSDGQIVPASDIIFAGRGLFAANLPPQRRRLRVSCDGHVYEQTFTHQYLQGDRFLIRFSEELLGDDIAVSYSQLLNSLQIAR